MHNISREYPLFKVDLVYLEPDEHFHFNVGTTVNFIAGFVFAGDCVRQSNGAAIPPLTGGIWTHPPEFGLYPMDNTAGPNGISWLCVSYAAEGQYEAQHVNVSGTYTLPAGWGFAVAQGEVTADSKTATQGLYFAPREVDVVVSGAADLLILRAN